MKMLIIRYIAPSKFSKKHCTFKKKALHCTSISNATLHLQKKGKWKETLVFFLSLFCFFAHEKILSERTPFLTLIGFWKQKNSIEEKNKVDGPFLTHGNETMKLPFSSLKKKRTFQLFSFFFLEKKNNMNQKH